MSRYATHTCGELRASDAGREVRIAGWVHRKRDLGGIVFLDLRDHHGLTQVVVNPEAPFAEEARQLRVETVVSFSGKVVPRGAEGVNRKLDTGEIEVGASGFEVLSTAETLPFPIADDVPVSETLRFKYRFLDLRRQRLHRNMVLRCNVISSLRRRMTEMGFLEMQTPILTSSSPEGARDFLVPSRLHPGQFYALPQAPQQFKQLLMVSGFHRYFQIAPCFRDEDARADRSPGEFYQLDLEMAFVEQEDVFEVVERLMHGVFTEFASWRVPELPFPRYAFRDAMRRFGTDKPDLRLPFELHDVSELFRESEFRVFRDAVAAGGVIRALPVAGLAAQSRKFFDELEAWAREQGLAGLGYVLFPADGPAKGRLAKALDEKALAALAALPGAAAGGGCFLVAGPEKTVAPLTGKLRLEVGRRLDLFEKEVFRFCWITDFPMYERDEDTGQIVFSHNPFSMPQGGLEALNTKDPLDILAYQYDIVCNGVELSSGAIRNHRPEIMYRAFELAGYGPETVDARFGGMIRAFRFGAPPHGGIAPGVDRIVMLLANEPNIREVILFPMTTKAEDLLMGAPAPVSEKQLKELHIRVESPESRVESQGSAVEEPKE
jgi:aspartyl-tRNA synthetase